MRTTIRSAAICGLAMSLGGCGTIGNGMSRSPKLYGGPFFIALKLIEEVEPPALLYPLAVVDIPFSFVLDTLLMPLMILEIERKNRPVILSCQGLTRRGSRLEGCGERVEVEGLNRSCLRHRRLGERVQTLRNLERSAKSLPAYIASLRDPEYALRLAALRALSLLGPEARPAIPAILGFVVEARVIGEGQDGIRMAASRAFWRATESPLSAGDFMSSGALWFPDPWQSFDDRVALRRLLELAEAEGDAADLRAPAIAELRRLAALDGLREDRSQVADALDKFRDRP